jgi:hypothetical protein
MLGMSVSGFGTTSNESTKTQRVDHPTFSGLPTSTPHP